MKGRVMAWIDRVLAWEPVETAARRHRDAADNLDQTLREITGR